MTEKTAPATPAAAVAPLPLDYQPRPWRGRRLVRDFFSRQRMADRVKTLAWVMPLTVLIWIYAEREQLVPADVFVPIEVVSTNPNEVIRLQAQSFPDKNLRVKLRAPRGQLEELRKRLPPNNAGGPLRIEIDPPSPAGTHALPTAELLRALTLFQGVEVMDAEPMSLRVVVDTVAELTAEVAIPDDVTNLESASGFEPRQVKVRGPREALARWAGQFPSNATRKVYADIAQLPVLKVPGPHELEVSLLPPVADENVTILPDRVKATLHVRQADVSGEIPSVPISLHLPITMQGYEISLSGPASIANVKVMGPPEQIKALQSGGAVGCEAILRLEPTMTDPGMEYERKVEIHLPAGFRLAPGSDEYKVKFHVKAPD